MTRRTAVFIIAAVGIIIALCIANIYISLRNRHEAKSNTTQAIIEYSEEDVLRTQKIVQEALKQIAPLKGEKGDKGEAGKNGSDGKDGSDGVTKTITEQVIIEKPVVQEPVKGKDGRTPILQVDPETCDLLMKYDGDTLWSVLIEGTKLSNSCNKEG